MSLRKKLSDRLIGEEDVQLRIPPVDPTAEVYAQAGRFASQMKELIDERNAYKERAEALLCQLDATHHQLHHVSHEREQYRRIAFRLLNANGKYQSALASAEDLFRRIKETTDEVNHLAPQVPGLPHKEEVLELDRPPEPPSQEEIEKLKATLSKLPQAE